MQPAGGNSSGAQKKGISRGSCSRVTLVLMCCLKILFLFPQEVVLSIMCQTGGIVDGFDAQNSECTIIYAWNYWFSPSSGKGKVTFVFVV